MAKKTVEMGRYYGSEALRNKKLQKKAIDYALDKLNPMIQNVGSQALDQLSTKIRPKKNYKTNRKDLDGGALARRKPTLTDKIAEGAAMFVNPTASWPAVFMKLGSQGLKGITDNIQHYRGGAVDIHKQIGKLPRPAKGWTLPGHKYTGPYNDLENQVRYNPETGEILEIYDKPPGPTDAVAMQHDVDYSVCGDNRKCKNKADPKMVKSLDAIPYNERQWGHWLARNLTVSYTHLTLPTNREV